EANWHVGSSQCPRAVSVAAPHARRVTPVPQSIRRPRTATAGSMMLTSSKQPDSATHCSGARVASPFLVNAVRQRGGPKPSTTCGRRATARRRAQALSGAGSIGCEGPYLVLCGQDGNQLVLS